MDPEEEDAEKDGARDERGSRQLSCLLAAVLILITSISLSSLKGVECSRRFVTGLIIGHLMAQNGLKSNYAPAVYPPAEQKQPLFIIVPGGGKSHQYVRPMQPSYRSSDLPESLQYKDRISRVSLLSSHAKRDKPDTQKNYTDRSSDVFGGNKYQEGSQRTMLSSKNRQTRAGRGGKPKLAYRLPIGGNYPAVVTYAPPPISNHVAPRPRPINQPDHVKSSSIKKLMLLNQLRPLPSSRWRQRLRNVRKQQRNFKADRDPHTGTSRHLNWQLFEHEI